MMARISTEQRKQIHETLLNQSKELFIQYGFSKTSIDDIVNACGIAKGSFYSYYPSKEELFYAVLRREEEIKNKIIVEVMNESLPPKELLIRFFEISFKAIEENAFLQNLYQRGEYEKIMKRLPKELIEDHAKEDVESSLDFVKFLQGKGITEKDPEILIGLFRIIMLLPLHREEIGEQTFFKTIKKLIECLSNDLTR
ncbi:TetR/AcrR family transcriptional regulator [Lysinibacillus xylanilyticus]|uniref:TetR/AcrR family transcriptional regulator n=1 Tax=Lysinibacillus xylanilyticus TaxID=582475 RepID=UPI002B250EFE|nr:TetR/AcrR family transcriptional regulator [Lysinibacillus xylanilyticus]MEB2281113.1 TetR/AcrR family transcriptional regulator [Lysinibacillus xylanilyticus]